MPSIIDVEASGFGAHSFPIEIGVVREDGARFCKLILPLDDWTHWDHGAEALHGITKSNLLEYGTHIIDVCRQLNDFVGTATMHSDGWVVDQPWLSKLYASARVEMTFRLSPLESLLKEYQLLQWDDIKQNVTREFGGSRHRASVDAMIIQQTYARVMKVQKPLLN